MASLNTLALLPIFLLLLHLKIAKSDLLSPLLSPLFDDVCKEVECGRGKCQPSLNTTLPFYICECDPGWKQTFSHKDDLQHLKFLPCIVPNCTLNSACSDAPSPVQEKGTKMNHSAFDICSWTDCGGGSCNKTTPFTYDCRCSEGYFNLLNVSAFPCYKECSMGMDCANIGISMTNTSTSTPLTPPVSQNDVNRGKTEHIHLLLKLLMMQLMPILALLLAMVA